MKKPRISTLIFYALILVLLFSSISALFSGSKSDYISYADAKALFASEEVASFKTKDDVLTLTLQDKSTAKCELGSFQAFYDDMHELIDQQYQAGIITDYDYQPDSKTPLIITMLPYILLIGAAILIVFVMLNRMGGGGNAPKFNRANARLADRDKNRVTFADVAGAEEEKLELAEIVDFLQDPEKYTAMGARIPKGVLLVGPPGTGKTLIAKAVAGEANVQFLSISGSDFVELYVGVGASRVRDLFEQAKKMAPSIVFIDEIDAVGRRRGAGMGGGHDEREQTLNQLLVEMDGFSKNEGVIVMAATNRKDILDPALLRPGRFDRQIYVDAPDVKGREAILKVHAKDKPLADNVDLKVIAKATSGMTGADLSNILNESALLAARKCRPCITMHDVEESILKVMAGPEKKSRVVSEHERKLTAIHEAGHAVAAYYLPTHDPVQQITIVPRGAAGGMTVYLPEDDTRCPSRNEMYEYIVSALGGRIAEQLHMGDITTGASSDLQQATSIARRMVTIYGMSEKLGAVVYDDGGEIFVGKNYEHTVSYSDRTAGTIDDEIKATIDRAYAQCTKLLTDHAEQLLAVSAFLLEHERMTRAQFEACMEGREIPESEESLFQSFLDKQAAENAASTEPDDAFADAADVSADEIPDDDTASEDAQ